MEHGPLEDVNFLSNKNIIYIYVWYVYIVNRYKNYLWFFLAPAMWGKNPASKGTDSRVVQQKLAVLAGLLVQHKVVRRGGRRSYRCSSVQEGWKIVLAKKKPFFQWKSTFWTSTHRIHVCMVYLPTWMVDFYGKCRSINNTWTLWASVNIN